MPCSICGNHGHNIRTCDGAEFLKDIDPNVFHIRICYKDNIKEDMEEKTEEVVEDGYETDVGENGNETDVDDEDGNETDVENDEESEPEPEKPKSKNLSGNEKRIESCKQVGGFYKKEGHIKEEKFNVKYNPECTKLTMKAESDCEISVNHSVLDKLLKFKIIKSKNERFTSNKSGKSIQLVLGNIPELLVKNNLEWIKNNDNCKSLLNKYMKKNNSNKPADLLVYDTGKSRIFFNMNDVIEYIIKECEFRKLESGRIKGDFSDNSKKGKSQYFTYEYRNGKHKSYFLGFSGGRGRPFILLIKTKIKFYEENY